MKAALFSAVCGWVLRGYTNKVLRLISLPPHDQPSPGPHPTAHHPTPPLTNKVLRLITFILDELIALSEATEGGFSG